MSKGAHMTGETVAHVSGRRRWPLAILFAALVTAAGNRVPSAGVAQTELEPQSTGLAGSLLTQPSAVRGTDGLLHIAYELVLTDATRLPPRSSRSRFAMPRPSECCSRFLERRSPRG